METQLRHVQVHLRQPGPLRHSCLCARINIGLRPGIGQLVQVWTLDIEPRLGMRLGAGATSSSSLSMSAFCFCVESFSCLQGDSGPVKEGVQLKPCMVRALYEAVPNLSVTLHPGLHGPRIPNGRGARCQHFSHCQHGEKFNSHPCRHLRHHHTPPFQHPKQVKPGQGDV